MVVESKEQNTIEEIRELTELQTKTLLKDYGSCALIRGTGFGKTWLVTKIANSYNKVLFLYPAEIIKKTAQKVAENIVRNEIEEELDDIEIEEIIQNKVADNVTFMSYQKWSRLSRSDVQNVALNFDLLIADECHRLGGEKTKKNFYIFIEFIRSMQKLSGSIICDRLICTATPFRTNDDFDVITEFADGHSPFDFTIKDMIDIGFVKAPIYACSTYFTDSKMKNGEYIISGGNLKYLNQLDRGTMKDFVLKNSRIFNPAEKIKFTCENNLTDADMDKMIFICFYRTFDILHELKGKVDYWFSKAFPHHSIEDIIVSSESEEYSNNVHKLVKLQSESKTIILIHSINMLNLGYHLRNITGIVMLRNTSSNIIYTQQYGRVLDSGDTEHNKIVFDFVDNISRRAIYSSDTDETYRGRVLDLNVIDDLKKKLKDGELSRAEYNKKVSDYLASLETYDARSKSDSDKDSKKIKVGQPDSLLTLYMDEEYLDMQEQYNKLLYEPAAIAVRQTLMSFFGTWCIANKIQFPLTQKELEVCYGYSWEDFWKWFKGYLDKYVAPKLKQKRDRTIEEYFLDMQQKGTRLDLEAFEGFFGVDISYIMKQLKEAGF